MPAWMSTGPDPREAYLSFLDCSLTPKTVCYSSAVEQRPSMYRRREGKTKVNFVPRVLLLEPSVHWSQFKETRLQWQCRGDTRAPAARPAGTGSSHSSYPSTGLPDSRITTLGCTASEVAGSESQTSGPKARLKLLLQLQQGRWQSVGLLLLNHGKI